jgi:hypothetical protein
VGVTLFTTQEPALPNETDNTYNLGTELEFSRDVYVLGGRRFAATSALSTTPYQLLWTADGVELARKEYGANSVGAWNVALYDTPTLVTAGTRVVSAYGPVNAYVATVDLFVGGLVNGVITAPANGSAGAVNGRFITSGAVAFPNGDGGDNCYFADVIIGDALTGAISVVLGGLDVEVRATGSAAVVATAGGGWHSLLNYVKEARTIAAEESGRAAIACPNDGEPLRQGPGGVLYCPYDGWRPQ